MFPSGVETMTEGQAFDDVTRRIANYLALRQAEVRLKCVIALCLGIALGAWLGMHA
jgi:uncharacterized membrane protein YfcA